MAWIDLWTGVWAELWGAELSSEVEYREFYNIQVEIYADTDLNNMLDVINARYEPGCLTELKAHGAGSFKVSKRDPKIATNPLLLAFRNYVKIRLNGKVIGGFIIQTKKTVIVGAGEELDETWEIAGEGPRAWTRDASVYPAKGLKSTSSDQRFFNFSAERGSWYNPGDWTWAEMGWQYNNVKNGAPKGHAPANWPDAPFARWMWETYDSVHPEGFCYFRHEFNVTAEPDELVKYAFFIAADDAAEVYVDGEQKVIIEPPGWHDTTRVELELAAGPHVIGVKAYNLRGPGEILTALFSYGDPLEPTSATLVNHSGMDNTWRTNGYPEVEPGWSVGDVLLTLLNEAKDRGVRFASNFIPMFSSEVDSGGNIWGGSISYSFGLGSTYESVIEAIEELGCDVYIDPDTMHMYVWKRRGFDRTIEGAAASLSFNAHPVIFSVAKNLVSADETGQAEIANTVMLHSAEGWSEKTAEDTTSVSKYGRVETQMATQLSSSGIAPLLDEMFRQKALPEVSATFEIVPVPGAIPFLDFNVGDWVSAPGEVPGVMEKRRVLSIAFTEDEQTGLPRYALEFDTIFKDRQTELERWMSRIANSSAIGGGFTNSSNLPPSTAHVPPGSPLGAIPDQPTGLTVSSVGHYQEDGAASSDFGLVWNPVITGSGFGSLVIDNYEVWGRLATETHESELLSITFDTMAYLKGYRPGDEWAFKVRAVSTTGGPGEFSDEVGLVAEAPLIPMEPPSKPTLTTGFGVVVVHWDGLLGGNPAPPYMRYIRVERTQDPEEGPWVPVGTLVGYAMNDIPGSPGNVYSYRLVAVDGFANESEPSEYETVTVKGVNSGDITGGLASNNLVANGSFEDGLDPFWEKEQGHSGATATLQEGGFSGKHYLQLRRVSEASGDEEELIVAQGFPFYIPISSLGQHGYFVSAKANATATKNKAFSIRVYWYLEDKVSKASTEFSDAVIQADLTTTAKYFAGRVFPPEDARYMRIAVTLNQPGSIIRVDDIVAREVISENMIGEDVISAVHMSAGSVTANALQAESVTAEAISAGAVEADHIAVGAIQVNHLSPAVGGSLDISANESVNILINKTEQMEGDIQDTSEAVTTLTTYYSFTSEGAVIGQTNSAFKLHLKNDRIQILENGIVVSYWDSGRMVVPSFVGEEVVLGNHKLEKYGNGTVVRAI